VADTPRRRLPSWAISILLPIALAGVLVGATAYGLVLPWVEQAVWERERARLADMTAAVVGNLQRLQREVESGRVSAEEARREAIADLRAMRYGERGQGYFWVSDLDGRMIVHPGFPALEGRILDGEMTAWGAPSPLPEMSALVRQHGAGFLRYRWPRPGDSVTAQPKEAYVKLFAPWGWVVGTGVYLQDVERELAGLRRDTGWVLAGVLLLVLALAGWLALGARRAEQQRAAAAAELAASRERYRLLAEHIRDVIWTMDLKLRFTYVSPSIEPLLGYTPEQMLAMAPPDYLTEASLRRVQSALQQEMSRDQAEPDPLRSRDLELEMIRADGATLWVEVRAQFLLDERQQPRSLLGVTRDMSARKAAEQDRERLERQLRQAQKMEAIGTLAGGIAHDFNNSLMAMMGFAQVAMDGADEQTRADLQQVLAAGQRASDLVQQILTFGRQLDQQRRPLQLQPLLAEGCGMLRAALPPAIELQVDLAAEPLWALAEPTQLRQVLMNLCTNAVQSMEPDGGLLWLRLEAAGRSEAGQDLCCLSVSDSGCGMDAATRERIFDPFFTTKPVDQGTGLGLSVVHGIVTGLGGWIEVDSQPDQGTTFHLLLPTCPPPDAADAQVDGPAGAQHEQADARVDRAGDAAAAENGDGERVLLIDDERAVAEVGRRLLVRLGYAAEAETDPTQALERLRANPDAFDLVICDQLMPGISGVGLAEQIHRLRPDLPLLLATGGAVPPELIERAAAAGVRDWLRKPFTRGQLAARVRRALDGR
jgi:PAS domain S-box-containing protein